MFTKIFAPKLPQWFHQLFDQWKVPFTESEPKNCPIYPKIPEDSQYQSNGDRLLPKKSYSNKQKHWGSPFRDGKNDRNFVRKFRNFTCWSFQVMPRAFPSTVYHSWPENKSKNSPYLGICGLQNDGWLQKNFSNSEIENWEPAQIIFDFERAIKTALEMEFPDSSHKRCYFHFTQAIYRHNKKLGLSLPYKEDKRFRLFTRYLMATPFCPSKVRYLLSTDATPKMLANDSSIGWVGGGGGYRTLSCSLQ